MRSVLDAHSQARIISGIRAFYKYLLMEDVLKCEPYRTTAHPQTGAQTAGYALHRGNKRAHRHHKNQSSPEGVRNKAMLETLYGCGLRVSELVNLKISDMFLDVEFIKVIGKGNKERLIPIGSEAVKYIRLYKDNVRVDTSLRRKVKRIFSFSINGAADYRV
jgi:integrase/recombinase XerD